VTIIALTPAHAIVRQILLVAKLSTDEFMVRIHPSDNVVFRGTGIHLKHLVNFDATTSALQDPLSVSSRDVWAINTYQTFW
jgi:hypothetical protein